MAGVVVGVGHPGGTGAAVRWASTAAERHGLPLTLVHAWNEPVDLTVELDPSSMPDLVGTATCCAVPGQAARALLAREPALLVLGGHLGARHLTHLTRSCLQHATCPVVVVPAAEQPPTGQVVVGVCGTAGSGTALRWAAHEAQLRHAELLVCYAWQVHPGSVHDLLHPAQTLVAQRRSALERLRPWVRQVLGSQQIDVQVTHGGPLDGLLEAGADADLIVVGGGIHSGLSRLLHSTISHDLIGLTTCPIAVIPSAHAAHGPLLV